MISAAIHISSRHVWTDLILFYSAFLNCIIIVHLLVRLYINKALGRLFSADLETSVLYITALEIYYLKIQLLVVFSPVLKSSELNSINLKYSCLL
jgi:hypothetical protein